MTEYDWLLIFFGAGLVVFLAFQGLARALFSLVLVWIATFASALLYREAAFRVQAIAGNNVTLVEGIMFDLLLVIFFVAGFILLKIAFPVTKLPNLGALDYIVAFLVAIIVAVLLVTVIANSIGVMVSAQWEDNAQGWTVTQWRFSRSGLRPYTQRIMSAYGWVFVPFFPGLPPVLIAQ